MATTTFYQSNRERAKEGVSPETLAYIEVLERIAENGYKLWTQLGKLGEEEASNILLDALAGVDFMHGEEEIEGQASFGSREAKQRG